MYCLKCRRVTETENIATAMSRNGRLMRRGQCIKCRKYFSEQTPFRNEFARTYLYWPGNKSL